MRRFRPNWKVLVLTLVFFLWSVLLVREPNTPLQIYLLTSIPAGWFVFNRLKDSRKKKDKEEDVAFPFGPFADIAMFFDFIKFAFKFVFKLIVSVLIGSVALPFIIIVGIIDLVSTKNH